MSDETETVYINDNPIGETEVYHARKGHATKVRRWRDRYVRETAAKEAQEEGYRPCKQCYPYQSEEACPACGNEGDGDDVLHNGQKWCPNSDCRVVSFNTEDTDRSTGGDSA